MFPGINLGATRMTSAKSAPNSHPHFTARRFALSVLMLPLRIMGEPQFTFYLRYRSSTSLARISLAHNLSAETSKVVQSTLTRPCESRSSNHDVIVRRVPGDADRYPDPG